MEYNGQIKNEKVFHNIDHSFLNGEIPNILCAGRKQGKPNTKQLICIHIKCQVQRVHMQRGLFTHCRSKTQLGYHCVPMSELLYQSKYLASCINGCCVKLAN